MPGLRDALFGAATAAAVAGGANLALPPSGPAATGEQVAISAYVHAARTASCPTDWRDLAAIRSIESPASIGTEQADGTVPGVAGPELDGSGVGGNTQAMYDADGTMSRAWGPMQFIRSSWDLFGRDANGDGIVSIDNIWDSSAAAAAHLCASRTAGASRWEAFRDYNGIGPAAARYADTAIARADTLPTDPGDVLAPVADAGKKLAAKAQCDIGTTPSGAPKVGDVANCAAQTTFERLLAGWEATGELIERDGNVQPIAGIYRMVDEQIARYLGGETPGPATRDLRATAPTSTTGARIVDAAMAWVGGEYEPGVPAQCAYFVRQVLDDAGITLTPNVTQQTLDQWSSDGPGMANSFGGDQGTVIRNKADLAPGDVVMWANTYGDWPAGSITHVGIYVGDGQIVDRPTAAAPVKLRSIDTFPSFVGAVRLP